MDLSVIMPTKDRGGVFERSLEALLQAIQGKNIEVTIGLDYIYFNIDDAVWPSRRVERLTRSDHFNSLICRPEVADSIGLGRDP